MPGTAAGVVAHIREQAAVLVARVNPAADASSPAFAAKCAEVAEALTRRLCLDLAGQGRAELARKIRIAWERSA